MPIDTTDHENLLPGTTGSRLVWAFDAPADLPLIGSAYEGTLAVVLNPLTIYVRNEHQWVPVASVGGQPIPPPTVVAASEAAAGIAEIATQDETDAGADNQRIVTPQKLAGRTATETRSGVVELATAAETQAGTDSARTIHPAALAARLAPEAWISPTLLGGWTNAGGSNETAGYHKDALGRVHLKGGVQAGTVGAAIFTLPEGYRPSGTKSFPAANGAGTGRIQINAGGDVIGQVVPNTTQVFSLEGVSFAP